VRTHIRPSHRRFTCGLVPYLEGTAILRLSVRSLSNAETAKYPEPLCLTAGVTVSSGKCPALPQRALPLLHRSYGLMRPTQSLWLLSVPLLQPVFAGCRPSLLGEGRSRRYLCNPCRGVWTPTPPHAAGAFIRFFPAAIGLTIWVSRSACGKLSVMKLQQSPLFRGCRHSLMFRLHHSLDPRVAPTVAPSGTRRLGLIHHAELGLLPSQAVASLYDRTGQLS